MPFVALGHTRVCPRAALATGGMSLEEAPAEWDVAETGPP